MKIVSIITRSGDDLTPAPMMRDSLTVSQRQAIRLANQAPMATRAHDERIHHCLSPFRFATYRLAA